MCISQKLFTLTNKLYSQAISWIHTRIYWRHKNQKNFVKIYWTNK